MTEAVTPHVEASAPVIGDGSDAAPLQIQELHGSPTNPRSRSTGDVSELAASIARHGILQPILVRRRRGRKAGWEIVFGERRVRGAREAGLETVPAFIRDLSDLEVLEIQIVENCQRQDIHPLEEADCYHALHVEHHLAVEDLAAKVGKSKAYVYSRMKLRELRAAGARKAFLAGEISPSVALLLARIPDEQVHAQAAEDLGVGDDPMSYREAASFVQAKYMLRLKDAPFSTDAAELVGKVGPCTVCPKRTGNQAELFADVPSADVCTDPACFAAKGDAAWTRRAAEAEARGESVLSEKETKKIAPYGFVRGDRFVDLSASCWEDTKTRSYRQLLGKDAPAVTLARTPEGKVLELVPAAEAEKVLKARHPETFGGKRSPSRGASDVAADRKYKLDMATGRLAIGTVLDSFGADGQRTGSWLLLVEAFLRTAHADTVKEIARRRGVEKTGPRDDFGSALRRSLADASDRELQALLLEGVMTRDAWGRWQEGLGESLRDVCKLYEVDLRATRAQAKKDLAPKPSGRKGSKKASRKKAQGPRRKKASRS